MIWCLPEGLLWLDANREGDAFLLVLGGVGGGASAVFWRTAVRTWLMLCREANTAKDVKLRWVNVTAETKNMRNHTRLPWRPKKIQTISCYSQRHHKGWGCLIGQWRTPHLTCLIPMMFGLFIKLTMNLLKISYWLSITHSVISYANASKSEPWGVLQVLMLLPPQMTRSKE